MTTAYLLDWLNMLLRWGHLITGIAWIGGSFYFIWLDNSLEQPSQDEQAKGIGGQLSAIHGGGFYEVAKYQLAPKNLPQPLHWFKWEAYTTWLTGFALFTLMFYVGAQAYLVDPSKIPLTTSAGIGISLATLVGGWLIYNGMCKSPLAQNPWLLAGILLAFITFVAWSLDFVFSDRAVYIHVGALIGTCMAANVYFVIMPGQRALVAAVTAAQPADPKYAKASKLRSLHNNYLTLPVLFLMVSNHYPMTYGHPYAWAVLLAIILIGAWTRHFFNLRHKGIVKPGILFLSAFAFILLAWVIAPTPITPTAQPSTSVISDKDALAIVQGRCTTCHSSQPSDDMFTVAPAGVMLDTPAQLRQWAPRILARVVATRDMPFMNKTEMTEAERALLGAWLQQD